MSTLLILAVAIGAALPLGLGTAIWLADYARRGSRAARRVRLTLDVLAGGPSIVLGLFGNALFSVWLGLGFSILSGGLTLACMVLPILIRSTETGLAAVPEDWRRGAAALGLSRAAALWHVILPAAAPALSAGLILGIACALVLESQVLLMDEPCSALDPIAAAVIEELVLRLAGRHTIVIVTHKLAQARRIANYAAFFWMTEWVGKLIEFGRSRTLFDAPNHSLTAAYVSGRSG